MATSNDVIRQYLISLSYKIDSAGQASFDRALGKSDLGFGKLTKSASLAGTAVFAAITKISSSLDNLYFASARTKASAENLTAFGYAASQTGASVEAAAASIESIASKLRRFPNMTQFMRNIGVRVSGDPTQDLVAMQRSLANKPMWLQLQYADMLGIEERVWLGLEKMGKFIDQRNRDAAAMGVNYKDATENANKLWTSLRRIADVLYMIAVRVEDNLFKRLGVDIDSFTNLVVDNSKTIEDTLTNLFEALLVISSAFALRMLVSPFGALVAMISALVLLIDDYQVWAKGGKSFFKWDAFDKIKTQLDEIVGTFLGVNKSTADWLTTVGLVLATMLAIPAALRVIGTATLATRGLMAGGAAASGGVGVGGLLGGLMAALGIVYGLGYVKDQNDIASGKKDPDSPPTSFGGVVGGIRKHLFGSDGSGSHHYDLTIGSRQSGANLSRAERQDNASVIAKVWRGLGWTDAQIAGGLSNIKSESDFDPTNHNTNGEDSYGLGQWSLDRRKRYAEWAGAPMEGSSVVDQARFMDYELKHQERATWDKINDPANKNNSFFAGANISAGYERPKDGGETNKRGYGSVDWLDRVNAGSFQGSYDMAGYSKGDTNINVSSTIHIDGAQSPIATGQEVARAQQEMIDRTLVRDGRARVQ